MKKSFMTRALAMGLSLAMAFSLSAATNVSVASAATAKPAMKSKSISVKVGQTKNYNATDATKKNYAIKNVKLSAAGKKAASVTWTAGKITVTGKAADSTKRNVKITFKNRKTKKNYYVTLKLVVKAAPVEEEKPAVSTAAAITKATQTTATKIAAEFSADMTGIKYTDLKIVRETGAVVTVKSATVDKNDNTKVAIETYEALTDGKNYTITYTATDESKTESSVTFTATAGVVADIALNAYTVPANTPTVIKYQLLDANGVLIEEKGIGKKKSDKVDISIENFSGYQNDDEITLYKTGDKATLKLVYHTWKYNNTDGTEEGKVERTLEITAVAQSSVIATYEYSIAQEYAVVDFKRDTLKTQIAVEDDKSGRPAAHFSFRKADGTDITSSLDYTVSSGNENVLLASGNVAGAQGAKLTPVAPGATYLVIKDASGNVVTTLPITVVAKRKLATMAVDNSNVTISQYATDQASAQKINITVMDQYSDAYTKFKAKEPELKSGNADKKPVITFNNEPVNNKITISVNAANNAEAGHYTYTMDLVDDEDSTNVKKVTFGVTVSKYLDRNDSYALVMMKGNDIVSKVDTTVGAGDYTAITLNPVIVAKNNGTIVNKATVSNDLDSNGVQVPNTAQVVSIGALTVKKGTSTVDAKSGTVYTVTNDNYVLKDNANLDATINVSTGDGYDLGPVVKNLAAGDYTVSLKARVLINGTYKVQPMSTSFKVVDSQKSFLADVKREKIEGDEADYQYLAQVFTNTDYVKFSYGGHEIANDALTGYTYVSSKATKVNSTSTRVEKVTMNVKLPGTSVDGNNNKLVQMTADVNRTFTFTKTPITTVDTANSASAVKKYAAADGTLKTGLTANQLTDVVKNALNFAAGYSNLDAADKATVAADKAKVEALGKAAAADILDQYPLAATPAVYEMLALDSNANYSESNISIYNQLARGIEDWSADTVQVMAARDDDVTADKVAKIMKDIIDNVKAAEDAVKAHAVLAKAKAGACSVAAITSSTSVSYDNTYDFKVTTTGATNVVCVATAGTITIVNDPAKTNIQEVTAAAISGSTAKWAVVISQAGINVTPGSVKVTIPYEYYIASTVKAGTAEHTIYDTIKDTVTLVIKDNAWVQESAK